MMETQSLTKIYRGRSVVEDVTLSFERGLIHALIGPNGAGKSTFLGMLGGLVPADGGRVLLDGQEISHVPRASLARRMATLLQSHRTDLRLSVRDLVTLGRYPHSGNRPRREDEIKVQESLEFMELVKIQESPLNELSGGERQRAYLAMTLAQDTEFLLLDEPLNNLDPSHTVGLMRLIRRLGSDLKKTVIVVLHDLNAAVSADRITAFKGGQVFKSGRSAEVLSSEILTQLYDIPFAVASVEGRLYCFPQYEVSP